MFALMKRVLTISGQYKWRIQLAFVTTFFHALLGKAPVALSLIALSAFLTGTVTVSFCLTLGGILLLCLALQCLLQNLTDRLQAAAGYMIFAEKRLALGRHLRHLPMGYFTEGNIGKISSVLSGDMVFVEENCTHDIANMMSDVFAQGIMEVFLFWLSPWLGLGSLLVLAVVWRAGHGSVKDGLRQGAIRQAQNEKLTGAILDYIEGIGIIKSYNLLGEKSKELTGNFRESCRTSISFEKSQVPWMRGLFLACGLGSALILAIALALFDSGALSAAYLLGVLLLLFDLFGPVKLLYEEGTRLTVMNSCMDRIEEVFGTPELPDAGKAALPEPAQTVPEIAFRNVSFSYGKKEVLHNISFSMPQGSMTALVGPSGGGKSTIASLLTRFWDVNQGEILLRGVDIRQLPLATLMDQVSVVFQRIYLFRDTIYNNISMGRPDATREEVMEAAKKARCYDFIMALPNGFDTVIGEGGASLSGGERQRISIARCILKDAPIVILDEMTSSVDADNERAIQEAISELCKGKTLLVIAHRLNTVRYADRILVVDAGRITQSGTHEELMSQDGLYREFVELQNGIREFARRA